MAAIVKFFKEISTIPSKVEANSLYCVRAGKGFDLYVTDLTGQIAMSLNVPQGKEFDTYAEYSYQPKGIGDKYFNNLISNYSSSVTDTGVHLGSGNVEKATISIINPNNTLKDTIVDNKSVLFHSGDNYGCGTITPTLTREKYTANNGSIFGNEPIGLLVGTLAKGSDTTFKGGTGNSQGVFLGFNNGLSPVGYPQQTIFKNVTVNNADRTSPVLVGSYNTANGNTALAIGMLNRVYGNCGVCIGSTPIADAYSSVGRFGVTIGFNIKAGEVCDNSVVIGSNLQVYGTGNIILGGGKDKYYGSNYWLGDEAERGVFTKVGNVLKNSNSAGMRICGNDNIFIGSKNRTEGFDGNLTTNVKTYPKIAFNSVLGSDNSISNLSFYNSVFGSSNKIFCGDYNTVIGSANIIQVEVNKNDVWTKISGNNTNDDLNLISELKNYSGSVNSKSVHYSRNNYIIGSSNIINPSTSENVIVGASNNISGSGNVIFANNETLNLNNSFYIGNKVLSGVNPGQVKENGTEGVNSGQLWKVLQSYLNLKKDYTDTVAALTAQINDLKARIEALESR